jgi:TolA-binding protein
MRAACPHPRGNRTVTKESAMRIAHPLLLAALVAAPMVLAVPARAQVETREGIALQNQILQLRQEMEVLRRGGLAAPQAPQGGSSLGFGTAAPRPAQQQGPQGELVGQLLDRVSRLEEELRSVRGRAEQAEFRERELRERVEKLTGDIDFRFQQLDGARGGAAAGAPAAAATPARPAAPPSQAGAAPQAQPAALARPPQRALQEGQAALARRDFAGAEAAAREVIAARDSARAVDAQILLGDALSGRRDFAAAAIAYDDAFRRNQQGTRAPEAMLGVANSLIGLNNNRDACGQLSDLRSRYPNLSGGLAERVADARRRAQCR